MHDMTSITVSDISTEMLLLRNEHFIFNPYYAKRGICRADIDDQDC